MSGPRVPPLAAEDHVCVACELSYLQVPVEVAVATIRRLPAAVREYVCHLRDVHVSYTVRLHRARTEDRPVLEPMPGEQRTARWLVRQTLHEGVHHLDDIRRTGAAARRRPAR